MQAIELETLIDRQGNIHLPENYRNLYGRIAKILVLLPESAESSKSFAPARVTKPEALLGCAGYQGPAKSLEEMEQGIQEEAKRQWRKGNSS